MTTSPSTACVFPFERLSCSCITESKACAAAADGVSCAIDEFVRKMSLILGRFVGVAARDRAYEGGAIASSQPGSHSTRKGVTSCFNDQGTRIFEV